MKILQLGRQINFCGEVIIVEKRKKYFDEEVLQNVNVRNQPEVNGLAGI